MLNDDILEKTKQISCALYITSKVAKNPIFRVYNLKYPQILTYRLILISDSDSTSKITPEMIFRFATTNTNPLFADLCYFYYFVFPYILHAIYFDKLVQLY